MTEVPYHYLVVGHSHAGTLKRGYEQWQEKLPQADGLPSCDFVLIRELGVKRDATGKRPKESNIRVEVLPFIRETVKRRSPGAIFAALFGNAHSIISIPQHPRPFDFNLPWRPELPFTCGAEIVPYAAIRQLLLIGQRERIARYVEHLKLASPETPVWLVPPPPPIASNTHILSNARGLGPAIETTGISPPMLRLKAWLANLDVLAEIAMDTGTQLVDLPLTVFDENGYLREEFLDRDPTHGNPAFGQLMMSHLCNLPKVKAQ